MFFNSIHFLFFLPIVLFLYFITPYRYRWFLLLVASYYFYMVWKPIYALLIVLSTLIDYYCSIKMGNLPTQKERKPYVVISIVANLLILVTFKYFNFFNEAAYDLAEMLNMHYAVPMFNVLLPMGISFYTFQTMSYSIDVYRGTIKPEAHLGKFALFVTYFPQLVAGPIERAKDLLPQFHFEYNYNHDRTISGLRLILWGLFKKIVIADQLSSMVGHVYNNPNEANGFSIFFASILFAQQVYCDFSAYSDIAQGSARIMGINLMDNFKFPLYSKSIDTLWKRWHISLVRWFTDYLYIPLGGSKKGTYRKYLNLLIIFFISGLWHGSNWTFIIWGVLNGLFVVYSRVSAPYREKMIYLIGLNKIPSVRSFLQIFGTIIMFSSTFIFFLSKNIKDALITVKNLFTGWDKLFDNIINNPNLARQDILYLGKEFESFAIIIVLMVIFEIIQWKISKDSIDNFFVKKSKWITWSIYLFLIFSIIIMSNVEKTPFIYFQF